MNLSLFLDLSRTGMVGSACLTESPASICAAEDTVVYDIVKLSLLYQVYYKTLEFHCFAENLYEV